MKGQRRSPLKYAEICSRDFYAKIEAMSESLDSATASQSQSMKNEGFEGSEPIRSCRWPVFLLPENACDMNGSADQWKHPGGEETHLGDELFLLLLNPEHLVLNRVLRNQLEDLDTDGGSESQCGGRWRLDQVRTHGLVCPIR